MKKWVNGSIKSLFFSKKKIICKLDHLSHFISGITTSKNMAKHLLKITTLPVDELSDQCGP